MRVKTFRGPSARQVMAQIKAELGPDAVILSNQTVREDGKNVCEVMAAVEARAQATQASQDTPDTRDASGARRSPAGRPGSGDWEREWGQIKGHLLAVLSTRMDLSILSPRQRMALEHLEREGVGQNALLTLWRDLRDDSEASILKALGRIVTVKPWREQHWPGRIHALAGASGMGKTTTVLRMALKHKRKHPDSDVLIVNADSAQAKGRLVLKHYVELSGLSYHEVLSPSELTRLPVQTKGFDRVFVDLPALSATRSMAGFMTEAGLESCPDVSMHLLASPCQSEAHLSRCLALAESGRLASLIWTKLDEACTFGSLVDVALESSLPVSALSFGPGLKGSLAPAEGMLLWRLMFKHQLPTPSEHREPEAPARKTRAAGTRLTAKGVVAIS